MSGFRTQPIAKAHSAPDDSNKTLGCPPRVSKERPNTEPSPPQIPMSCLLNDYLNFLCPLTNLNKILSLSKHLSFPQASELPPILTGPADSPPRISNLQGKTFPDQPSHHATHSTTPCSSQPCPLLSIRENYFFRPELADTCRS